MKIFKQRQAKGEYHHAHVNEQESNHLSSSNAILEDLKEDIATAYSSNCEKAYELSGVENLDLIRNDGYSRQLEVR